MTVADNTSRNQYTATSGQTVFAYTFEIVDKGDIVVLKNGTTLSEGTNYTVSNVGNDSGGNVTLTVGATAGDILTLYRDMPYARTQNYTNSGDFLASEVNSDFDNLWLAGEQTNRSFSQSIRKPITDSDSISMELPEAATRVNSFLTFDSTGAVSVESLASGNNPTNIFRQQFTGNGSTTVFTLATDPGSAAAVMIYIDGVYQQEGTYTVSGTSLTFTEAPPVNASIEAVLYRVTDIGTTDAGSVTYLPAGTGAVQTTVQTKLRESVSVKDFGAVGDGVTDDTAAIQAALDYAKDITSGSAVGAEVFMPSGHYIISSTIILRDKVALRGSGNRSTFVQAKSTFTDLYMFRAYDEPDPTTSMFGAFLTDMQIDFNDLNISGSAAVYAQAWQENSGLRRVVITGWRDTAVQISDGFGGAASLKFEDVEIFSSADGGLIGIDCEEISATGDFFLEINQCTITGDTTNKLNEGIKIAKDTLYVSGLHFEQCTNGVSLYDAADFQATTISGGPGVTSVIIRNSTHTGNISLGKLAKRTATNAIDDNRSSGAGPDITRDLLNYNDAPAVGSNAGIVAWCVFNAGTTTIIDSYNVSTLTQNAVGDFSFNFINPTPALASGGDRPVSGNFSVATTDELWIQNKGGTVNSHRVMWKRGGAYSGGGYNDPRASVIIFGRSA